MWESESASAADYPLSTTKNALHTDGFERRGHSWYVSTDIPSDFLVQIGDISFHLHKTHLRVPRRRRHQQDILRRSPRWPRRFRACGQVLLRHRRRFNGHQHLVKESLP